MIVNPPGIKTDTAGYRRALAAGRFDVLRERCVAALRIDRADAAAHYYLGLALEGLGDRAGAAGALDAACVLEPTGERTAQLARVLAILRQDDAAGYWLEQAVALGLTAPLDLDTVGCVLSRLGRHEAAASFFRRAVGAEARNVQYRYNLAVALDFIGDPRGVDEHETLLALNPDFARSHLAIATLYLPEGAAERVDRIVATLERVTDPGDRLLLQVAAAKEMEQLGRYEEAFAQLRAGKNIHHARIGHDPAFDDAIFQALADAFGSAACFAGAGYEEVAPIFVIGMPRSGTTLVERILTAHPALVGAGELQAMPLAAKSVSGVRSPNVLDPRTIAGLYRATPAAVGREYLRRAASHVDVTQRFVDKLPMNFLYAGFIARALPNARIICLRRNPMDVVWSNYKHLFAPSVPSFNYSYDIEDCARYVVGFERLMAFWHQLMPGRILDIGYEDLVADPKGMIQQMLGHAGLSWSDDCLRFFDNASPVATPSAAQVRQPIYSNAIGAWQRFASHLEPASRLLAQAGLDRSTVNRS